MRSRTSRSFDFTTKDTQCRLQLVIDDNVVMIRFDPVHQKSPVRELSKRARIRREPLRIRIRIRIRW